MRRVLLALVLFALAGCGRSPSPSVEARRSGVAGREIWNGKRVAAGTALFMGYVSHDFLFEGTGFLVCPSLVLTAGHVIPEGARPGDVRFHARASAGNFQAVSLSSLGRAGASDLAAIALDRPVPSATALAYSYALPPVAPAPATLYGFGPEAAGGPLGSLRFGLGSYTGVVAWHPNPAIVGSLRVRSAPNGVLPGDSGGPLVIGDRAYGALSWATETTPVERQVFGYAPLHRRESWLAPLVNQHCTEKLPDPGAYPMGCEDTCYRYWGQWEDRGGVKTCVCPQHPDGVCFPYAPYRSCAGRR